MTPRLLFLSHSGVLGGGERSLLDLAGGWKGEREVIVLADGPFVAALAARGVPHRVEPLGALGRVRRESVAPGLGAIADVARLATLVAKRARQADAIHANSQKAFVVAAAAGLLARRPVIWHLRDLMTRAHFSTSNIRAAVFLANARAAAVIANSEATAAAFREAGGRSGLVHVVHNGISPAPFDAVTDAQCASLRTSLGAGDTTVLTAVARLAPWKGQHVVLAAAQAIPDVHVWIVGAALFGEGAYAAGLKEQAVALGIGDRVRFLGEREEVPVLLRASDVVVHCAVEAEPFGRVVVEGMLAGRPVIASDAGGVHEIITDGRTGFLVKPGDPVALAERVRTVRGLPERERQAVCVAARADAEARFSPSAMIAGVERVVEAVVSAGRSRR